MTYRLLKKPHATDEFTEFGRYNTDNPREILAMSRAVFDFGRWMYSDFKIEEVRNEIKGSEADS